MWTRALVRGACASLLSTTLALGQDGGDSGTPDAGAGGSPATVDAGTPECTSSGECARPTPYCHPTLARCVACLGDTNCISSTGVCDEPTGECVACATDAHCFGSAPYCDGAKMECVQCLTDENCGTQGIACIDGACGSCGDGICGPGESIVSQSGYDPYGPPVEQEDTACLQDCLATCPAADLGSALGPGVATGTLTDADEDRLASPNCGGGGAPDRSFGWSAPTSGTYVIDSLASEVNTLVYVIRGTDCSQPPFACGHDAGYAMGAQVTIDADAGEPLVIVLDSFGDLGDFSIGIYEISTYDGGGLDCNPADCPRLDSGEPPCCTGGAECGGQFEWGCDFGGFGPPPFNPTPDGGTSDPVVRDRCLTNALSGGRAICIEVAECACASCAQATEDCRVIPGCLDLIECMAEGGCAGLECNVPELCQPEIASSGGVNGPGFRAAAALQTCANRAACDLDCPDTASADAGAGGCTAGREESCECDDGASGVRICKEDGSGFSPCVCVDAPDAGTGAEKSGDDGGCSCRVGRRRSSGSAVAGLLLALGVVARRRRGDTIRLRTGS